MDERCSFFFLSFVLIKKSLRHWNYSSTLGRIVNIRESVSQEIVGTKCTSYLDINRSMNKRRVYTSVDI